MPAADMEIATKRRKREVEEEPGYYCLLEYSSEAAMIADLGGVADVTMIESEVVVGGEVTYNDFTLEFSDDGSSWEPENPVSRTRSVLSKRNNAVHRSSAFNLKKKLCRAKNNHSVEMLRKCAYLSITVNPGSSLPTSQELST